MGDYFRGWKRRAGVVTLAVSCVLAVGWLRSIKTYDLIRLPGMNSNIYLISCNQQSLVIAAGRCYPITDLTIPLKLLMTGIDDDTMVMPIYIGFSSEFLQERPAWESRPAREIKIEWTNENGAIRPIGMISYCFIVIPLTLLSAYLLFSKPQSKRSPTPERPESGIESMALLRKQK